MKKIFFLFITFIFSTSIVLGEEINEIKRYQVELIKCDSATTSWVSINGETKRIRLLAFDSEDGSLNQEIDEYVCNLLTKSKNIEIEYDPNAQEKDKYNRELVWVYVDNILLQNDLISKGYGQVNYINSEYQYLDTLCNTQLDAIKKNLGIWQYEGIKEEYCKSGIKLNETKKDKDNDIKNSNNFDRKNLQFMLFVNSGIVILVVLMRMDKVKNKYGKR